MGMGQVKWVNYIVVCSLSTVVIANFAWAFVVFRELHEEALEVLCWSNLNCNSKMVLIAFQLNQMNFLEPIFFSTF